jgi:hypothetical protein
MAVLFRPAPDGPARAGVRRGPAERPEKVAKDAAGRRNGADPATRRVPTIPVAIPIPDPPR